MNKPVPPTVEDAQIKARFREAANMGDHVNDDLLMRYLTRVDKCDAAQRNVKRFEQAFAGLDFDEICF